MDFGKYKPDIAKIVDLDFEEIRKCYGWCIERLVAFDPDNYADPRNGQLELNAYKEMRQQLAGLLSADDARRDRIEVEELRDLVRRIELARDQMHSGGAIYMDAPPEYEQ